MKEIKTTRTIEEVTAYEADDGTRFKTADECKKYENSAHYAIYNQFLGLAISKPFPECTIFENFGYGSEEYNLVIVDIKDEKDLKIANMFAEMQVPKLHEGDEKKFRFDSSRIGQRILVAIGNEYSENCYVYGTQEELIEMFKQDIDKYYNPKSNEKEED